MQMGIVLISYYAYDFAYKDYPRAGLNGKSS